MCVRVYVEAGQELGMSRSRSNVVRRHLSLNLELPNEAGRAAQCAPGNPWLLLRYWWN
jgi:hypothetical protein